MNPAEPPVFTAAQKARWVLLATLIEEKPRFTSQAVAAQVAAALNAAGCTCRVDLEPHFVTPDEIRLGSLATVTILNDDGQPMGYPNEAIWEADLEATVPGATAPPVVAQKTRTATGIRKTSPFTVKVTETRVLTFKVDAVDEDEAVDLALASEEPVTDEFQERALESVVRDGESDSETANKP